MKVWKSTKQSTQTVPSAKAVKDDAAYIQKLNQQFRQTRDDDGSKQKSSKKSSTATRGRRRAAKMIHLNRNEGSYKDSKSLSRLRFKKPQVERRVAEEKDQVKLSFQQFGPDASAVLDLEIEEGMPSPEAPDHVVVKVQASTVTLDDCMVRRGFDFDFINPLSLPNAPGHDVVGHICCAGKKVADFKEGDRVAALVRTGGNARFVSVPMSSLVKIPKNVDAAEAATMVSIYTTAYQTLKNITQEGPTFSLHSKRVLVVGGMDAVGQALIQMCVKARADIYATAPMEYHQYVRNILGAHPLSEQHWLESCKGSMDFVFDGVCEDGSSTPTKALKKGGELVCYGRTAMLREVELGYLGASMSARINKFWSEKMTRTKSINIWESFQSDPAIFKKNVKSLCQLLKANKIKPHIAKRIGLDEVAQAQTDLEHGIVRGVVVCLPWNPVMSSSDRE